MRFEEFYKNPIQAMLCAVQGGDCAWEIVDAHDLPEEIRYALELGPSRYKQLEQLLNRGVYLAMRTHRVVPEQVNEAINNVSDLAQGGLVNSWIEDFLGSGQKPMWGKDDELEAGHSGLNLEAELKKIQDFKNEHQKLFVVSSGSASLLPEEQALIDQINAELGRISGRLLPAKIISQAESRVEFAMEMVLLCAIALCLAFVFGAMNFSLGVFLAVVLPGLAAEAYRAYLGHGAGMATWQIKSKAIRRLPYALASIFLAILGLWLAEYAGLAAFLFGLAALILPLSHFASFMAKTREGIEKQKTLGRIGQDVPFLQAIDYVRIAAFAFLPIGAWLICAAFPSLSKNYFFLTALGLCAWTIPSLAVGAWSAAQTRLFKMHLRRALGKSVYRTGDRS